MPDMFNKRLVMRSFCFQFSLANWTGFEAVIYVGVLFAPEALLQLMYSCRR